LNLAITQIELTLEVLQAVAPEAAAVSKPAETESVEKPRRHRPARRALPAHLPRQTLVHQSPEVIQGCGCASCGGTLRKLGKM
jgi:hypothetical protein